MRSLDIRYLIYMDTFRRKEFVNKVKYVKRMCYNMFGGGKIMKRILSAVIGVFMILGVFGYTTESVLANSVKTTEGEVSDNVVKPNTVEILDQNEKERLYEKYKNKYDSIDGEVFYVLIGEKFGEMELYGNVEMRLQRTYLEFREDGVFTSDTTNSIKGVTDIDELRRKSIKNTEMSTADVISGIQMEINTIVSEEVLEQWKEEGYDGKGSYWHKAPEGLTYEMLKMNLELENNYKKYEKKYESVKGITFYVLLREKFNQDEGCFERDYIAFRNGKSYPVIETQIFENLKSIDDLREMILKGRIGPEKFLLNKNTIVSDEVIEQWEKEEYDGEGVYWSESPRGLSYKDLSK